MTPPLLSIEDLRTVYATGKRTITAVDGVDLTVSRGTTLGLVGESGCGKSALSLSLMGLLPEAGRITSGSIVLDGKDIANASPAVMRTIRGRRIAMVFQEPMTSLNPLFTIGFQLAEAMRAHDRHLSARAARDRMIRSLHRVRIPSPERRLDEFAHQMSGGMRQRVMIAMALSCSPDLLIADEPTTALDVTVQAEILDVLGDLQAQTGMAIILITHDLGVVASMADEIAVMYAGRIVERASTREIFENAQHPYTLGLLGSIPRIDREVDRLLAIEGTVPPPGHLPDGCSFHPRCVFAGDACRTGDIRLMTDAGHATACIRAPVESIRS